MRIRVFGNVENVGDVNLTLELPIGYNEVETDEVAIPVERRDGVLEFLKGRRHPLGGPVEQSLHRAIEQKRAVEIYYISKGGEESVRTISPREITSGPWVVGDYVDAYCHERGEPRRFLLSGIKQVLFFGENA
jgi:predicted DNA-binding transcriptional regulator YafY